MCIVFCIVIESYIHICTNASVYPHPYAYPCTYILFTESCVCPFAYVCFHPYPYAYCLYTIHAHTFIHGIMCMSICISMCSSISICVCLHTSISIRIYAYPCTYIYSCVCPFAYVHGHPYPYAYALYASISDICN